jgi:tetratricopeptide (TPR) repeat protein
MRLTRFAVSLVFILAISYSPLVAQDYFIRVEVSAALSKAPWFEVQSRNFHVTGNADLKQLRRIAVDLEEIRRYFLTVYPKKAASLVPTTVIVFRNTKTLQMFFPGSNAAGGVYSGVDRTYIVLNADERRRRSVYHDYVHTLMGHQRLPLWLREGLAEYFGSIESERYMFGEGRTLQIGYPIFSHESLLSDRSFLPFNELFAMTNESATYHENTSKSVFVAESWALVHMLLAPGFEDLMKRFLEMLVDKNSPQKSFQAVYDAEPGLLETRLKDYVKMSRKSGWTYTRIPYCLCDSKPLDWIQFNFDRTQSYVKDLGNRRLTDAEIRFYVGDLLLHNGSLQEAGPYLEDALRLTPEFAPAHGSLAVLRMRQEDYQQAKEHIDRALALGSDNPLAYLFYAKLVQQEAPASGELTEEQLQNMQTALQKAVRLGPDLNEAVDLLSEVDSLLSRQ